MFRLMSFVPRNFRLKALVAAALLAGPVAHAAPPVCSGPSIMLSDDYAWFVGGAGYSNPDGTDELGSTFRWVVNGTTAVQGAVGELLFLNFDNSLSGAAGEKPTASNSSPGRGDPR